MTARKLNGHYNYYGVNPAPLYEWVVALATWQPLLRSPATTPSLENVGSHRRERVGSFGADPRARSLSVRASEVCRCERLLVVEALARHVLGVDGFFEWTSAREMVGE